MVTKGLASLTSSIKLNIPTSQFAMHESTSNPKVFLSYAHSDKRRAEEMRKMLHESGAEVFSADSSIRSGDSVQESIRAAIASAAVVFVLIGPSTRTRKWVDKEIELATQGTPSRPAPGLVAVVLPEHDDYSRPFYDPENVPLRIHDHVSRESAILRKWPKDPAEIRNWISESLRRRQRFPAPFVNFSTQSALSSFNWDESVDEPLPEKES